jgi:hypothetical protein
MLWVRRALVTYDPQTKAYRTDKWALFQSTILAPPKGATSQAASVDPDGFLAFERSLSAE